MTELTQSSLEAALTGLYASKLDRVKLLDLRPTRLLIRRDLERTAAAILGWVTGKHTQRGSMRKRKKGRMACIKAHRTTLYLRGHDDVVDVCAPIPFLKQ